MLNFKYRKISPICAVLFLILGSCQYDKLVKRSAPPDPVIKDSHTLMCEMDVKLISLFNNLTIDGEDKKRLGVLSGVASKFQHLVPSNSYVLEYKGLEKTCDFEYSKLVVDCNGEVTLVSSNKTESLTLTQLSETYVNFVHEAEFCGEFVVAAGKSLFIRADIITLKDFSVKIEDGALLSISAEKILQPEQFANVTSGSGSVLSIHVEKE
jgi:hypothetical protein